MLWPMVCDVTRLKVQMYAAGEGFSFTRWLYWTPDARRVFAPGYFDPAHAQCRMHAGDIIDVTGPGGTATLAVAAVSDGTVVVREMAAAPAPSGRAA